MGLIWRSWGSPGAPGALPGRSGDAPGLLGELAKMHATESAKLRYQEFLSRQKDEKAEAAA